MRGEAEGMNARFQPPSVSKDVQPAGRPLDDAIPARQAPAGLADCCPAKAAHTVVRALPGTSGDVAAWISAGSLARA